MKKCDFCQRLDTCGGTYMTECIVRDYVHFVREDFNNGTERQKLINLLQGKSLDTIENVEYVVDYLLKNGVKTTEAINEVDTSKPEFQARRL